MRSCNHRSDQGLTLIELLVVISILGILAGLALPAVARARKRGDLAGCLNNSKQLAAAMLLYSGDQNDLFPYAIYTPVQNGPVLAFDDYLYSYLGGQLTSTEQASRAIPIGKRIRLLTCPADKAPPSVIGPDIWRRSYSLPEADMSGNPSSGGIGFYYSSFWGPTPAANPALHLAFRQPLVLRPDLTLLVVERPHRGNWGGNDHYAVTRNVADQLSCFPTLQGAMDYHGKGVSVCAYCDGRVVAQPADKTGGTSSNSWNGQWTIRTDD